MPAVTIRQVSQRTIQEAVSYLNSQCLIFDFNRKNHRGGAPVLFITVYSAKKNCSHGVTANSLHLWNDDRGFALNVIQSSSALMR